MQFETSVKRRIEEAIRLTVKAFGEKEDTRTAFGEPAVGYADCENPLFDMFFSRGICQHPKKIFQPGNTVIVYFIPYGEAVEQSNRTEGKPSSQWLTAYRESLFLSMEVNRAARAVLDTVGRLSSCANTPVDWDESRCREEWSHKLAAFAAGMGCFGPAGSFFTEKGFAGRMGSIITDGRYAEPFEKKDDRALAAVYEKIQKDSLYSGFGSVCPEEMIRLCPAGAASPEGIDPRACQAYCRGISDFIPSPDVCGKCFALK